MKLLIVLGIHEHQTKVAEIFKESGIPNFSKVDVEGFKSGSTNVNISNWFGGAIDSNMSIMFFAFVPQQNAEKIIKKVLDFNVEDVRLSPLHAFQLPVEKFI